MCGRLTACKHGNGRDWWLITRKAYTNIFYSFLITPTGIGPLISQSIGDTLLPPDLGQAVFSPQGNKYALVDHINHLRLFDFDRCTGIFSNPIYIPILDSMIARGVAFSSSGQYLYVSSDVFVYQYDMYAGIIESSRQTVAVWDSFYSPSPPFATTFYMMQLAPDGKIYINSGNGVQHMHVINNPDSAGLLCDVCQHCLPLPTYNAFTHVNHPNYFLGAETGSTCDSLTIGINELSSVNLNLKTFPNPIAGHDFSITYLLAQNKTGQLEVLDVNGRIIYKKVLPQWSTLQQINIPALHAGVYLLRLITGNGFASTKIVVQ